MRTSRFSFLRLILLGAAPVVAGQTVACSDESSPLVPDSPSWSTSTGTTSTAGASGSNSSLGYRLATPTAAPLENDAGLLDGAVPDDGSVFVFQCAEGASCGGTPECSMSEGIGFSACALICTCGDAGVFDCTQSCPPDAAPPADCAPGVECVPGVWCGGDPPMCLCDNTGHLECGSGYDGGSAGDAATDE
jgi:hypothetical protein